MSSRAGSRGTGAGRSGPLKVGRAIGLALAAAIVLPAQSGRVAAIAEEELGGHPFVRGQQDPAGRLEEADRSLTPQTDPSREAGSAAGRETDRATVREASNAAGGETDRASRLEVTLPMTSHHGRAGVPSRAVSRAWQGEPVRGGGTLEPGASWCPATINGEGRIAFVSRVEGSERNQGVFVADKHGLEAIAIGCGACGGSGDPSPVGGTFSGFFLGTAFAPDINDAGDVLFIADIADGDAKRGLFLYRAASRRIETVAATGDPSPAGGSFESVGLGSLNRDGRVVFLAGASGGTGSDIYLWSDGVVTKLAGAGDAAPGGGRFLKLGTESFRFSDGSSIPSGPVPDINDKGHVAFRGIVEGGQAERGVFLSTSEGIDWVFRAGDPAPGGGRFTGFWAPVLNNEDEIAVLADYDRDPGLPSSGWFVASRSGARKALAFYDAVDGGRAMGLAISRNPMQPLDDAGNLLLWTSVDRGKGGLQEELTLSLADGALEVVTRQGDRTPVGGEVGAMQAWPSLRNGRGTLSAATAGREDGANSAHMLIVMRSLVSGKGSGPRTLDAP